MQALEDIRQFEQQLADSGAVIVKFWLHISKREQKKRFQQLLASQATAWKVGKAERRQHRHYDAVAAGRRGDDHAHQQRGRAVDDRRGHPAAFRPRDRVSHPDRGRARSRWPHRPGSRSRGKADGDAARGAEGDVPRLPRDCRSMPRPRPARSSTASI